MARSPSAVFLLDTASPGRRERLQLRALRLLNHLCCRFGLARLRWAYRFFDSLGGRGGASRGGGFRPPAPRAWARFEEELAERLGARGSSAVLPGPATRLALTHGGLKETLLDFQWDRPEIASPAKAPRGSRGPPSDGFANAVFLFSPCPRSRRELWRFVSGGGAAPAEPPALQDVAEKLLPRSVRELLAEQKITLYWVDTAESSEVRSERSAALCCGTQRRLCAVLPLFSVLIQGEKESCAVILEPLAMSQRRLHCPLNIVLKGSMMGWNWMQAVSFLTESWVLRSSDAECTEQNRLLFHQLLRNLVKKELHMIAEVSHTKCSCPCTAVLSPLSENAAVLTLFCTEKAAEVQRCGLEGAVVETSSQDHALHLPDVVHSVLSEIDMAVGDSLASTEETPVPEWVRRELSSTGGWHPSVLEAWYSSSNACGASLDLMDSFRLLQVPCSDVKNDADQSVVELSGSLSELYQRKFSEISAGAGSNKKRRGVPRTPVRQKMKTMSRSLQMLNVARLNVKAQKFQPDAMPTVSEKAPQKLSAKRLDEKLEEKEKALKASIDFKTEEELRSHLSTSYQRVVAEEVLSSVSAQHMIMAIKRFLKIQDAKEKEVGGLRGESQKPSPEDEQTAQTTAWLREGNQSQRMTDMLRILCLAEDSGYLTKFLEEILELYMNSIPKTLGDLYYSLGTQIPPKLASVLPSDFFSDDSMTVDSRSPGLPPSLSSVLTPTAACLLSESDQLEELRTRSAKKRRNNVLARHRSMTEASQNLRQIEIPKIDKNPIRKERSRSYLAAEKSQQMPLLQKETVQEVTKVRRNLFNEGIRSPSKRTAKKMPRSQSVSAVEGLRYKCTDEGAKDHHKLLTKRVAETPLHKQVSRRLLHKQIKGRSSDPGCDAGVVEESPEKAISGVGLHSGCLTPKRFFFGAVIDNGSPAVKHSPGRRRTRKDSLNLEELPTCQTPRKTPHKSAQKLLNSASKPLRRSPRLLHKTPQKVEKTPSRSSAAKQGAAKCLGKYFSHPARRVKSPSVLTESKSRCLLQVTKDCSPAGKLFSPHKETGLQMPEHNGMLSPVKPLLPLQDSTPAASSLPATQEGIFAELQTPRRSRRSLSKLTSPVGARRQILPTEIEMQPEPVSQGMGTTPRKAEDLGSELSTTPSDVEMSQLTMNLKSPFSSPLSTKATNGVAVSSPPHVEAKESDREFNVPEKSLLKSPGVSGTLLESPLNASRQAIGDPNAGGEKRMHTFKTASENKGCHRDNGDNAYVESLQFCKSQIPEATHVLQNKQMDAMTGNSSLRRGSGNLGKRSSPKLSAGEHVLNVEMECEQSSKEGNSSVNTSESFLSSSQTSTDELEQKSLQREEYTGPKALSLKRHSRFTQNTSPPLPKSAPAYSLRCTADRRQREAAARMGNPELPAKLSAPKICCQQLSESSTTYEVELEMQASGLPKLRFKKVGSCSALDLQPEANASKPKGGESPFGDLSTTWCSKHPGKPAAACVSPSCFRSFHDTPGKGGGQTYICQSYTPTSCASNTTSPSPLEAEVPWSPPKLKGKTTPDAIKDWPRRKRAASSTANSNCGQGEKNADEAMSASREGKLKGLEQCSSKVTCAFGEFELEGVYRLQDQVSPNDTEPRDEERSAMGASGLTSRKRVFTYLSPEKEEDHEAKRACTDKCNMVLNAFSPEEGNRNKARTDSVLPEKPKACLLLTPVQPICIGDDDVFLLSGATPPVKSSLSASSLLALTQSPLLCKGQTPPSRRKRAQDEESNDLEGITSQELSPFHSMASRKRPLSRTYSRKRLLS
ncbi:hypothetical protein ASZ78_009122 [Callipepla squamata]|uniref:Treslin N-terminal domain-containing protein n=1 Tax=Callipepla squamata TaxID=9009 RepID=A0A226MQG5_CALSU|nr:hypothetical protein ASZ78_009122 [Callipepla squamata]